MYQYMIDYRRPHDRASFEEHYRGIHRELTLKFPGLRRFAISKVEPTEGLDEDIYMIGTLYFDDLETLNKALESPERDAAREDAATFARPFLKARYIFQVDWFEP